MDSDEEDLKPPNQFGGPSAAAMAAKMMAQPQKAGGGPSAASMPPKQELGPDGKPKRKRRTKAEMEAFRAAQAAAKAGKAQPPVALKTENR